MRISLVRPIAYSESYDPEVQEALGIEALASVLRQHGHSVQLYDAMIFPQSEAAISSAIVDFFPNIIGVSLMTDADVNFARAILDEATPRLNNNVRIVAGGSFVTTEPERAASGLPPRTVLIRDEGELPLLALLGAEANPGIPGDQTASSPRSPEQLANTHDNLIVDDLDSLPWPSRDFAKEVMSRNHVLNLQGSRGCTGRCSYCCMSGLERPNGKRWRGRSPKNIVEEMSKLYREYGTVSFNFVDDDFLGPAPQAEYRALAFVNAIKHQNLHVGFGVQLRPHSLTEGAIDALAEAGLAYAFIGIENNDPATMHSWQRRPCTEHEWLMIDRLVHQGIEVAVGTILFHPNVTLRLIQTFVTALIARGHLNFRTATSRLHLLPGSPLFGEYSRQGAIPANSTGPYTPPLQDGFVRRLHDTLLQSLAPLRPCWVHAASQLPGYVSLNKAGRQSGNKLVVLQRVLCDLDTWVREILETSLAAIPGGDMNDDWVFHARARSCSLALAASQQLSDAGLVLDAQQLRTAIVAEGTA
jgi:anaerobic magnesium-protoporphyrin IX monomethyl ester cyclase